MRDVVAAQRERIFVSGPIAPYQFRLESFLFEEALLISDVNRGFARETNITDADFVRIPSGGRGVFITACRHQNTQ